MTEEKYNELKMLKEEITRLESKLLTINNLIQSTKLNMEITGVSTCIFKITRFLNLDGDNFIKTILKSEKELIEKSISVLNDKFKNQ